MFGIDALEPGHRRFTVRPRPGGIDQAEIRVPTMSGTIEAAFSVDGDSLLLALTVPANATAEVRLPGDEWWQIRESGHPLLGTEGVKITEVSNGLVVLEVGCGTYAFLADPKQPEPTGAR